MLRQEERESGRLISKELNTQQWIELARQVADAGTVNLLITGGEPMVRKDFCQIYREIYQMGFIITLYTNATLVTDEIMQTLKKYPPHRIGITLYGASDETYQKVCGARCFKRVLEGSRKLATLPSVIEFRTTLIKDNLGDLESIEELVRREFGTDVTHTDTVFRSVRDGCSNVESCRLSPEEMVDLTLKRMVEKVRGYLSDTILQNVEFYLKKERAHCITGNTRYSLLGCSSGMDSYTITWDGKLIGCQLLDTFYTDAVKKGFIKAWEEYPLEVKLPPLNEECRQCSLAATCKSCPAIRIAECGNMEGIPKYFCEIEKLIETRKGATSR